VGDLHTYRIYCFDGVRDVWASDSFQAPNDEAAVATAKAVDGAVRKEVWRGSRLVASLNSDLHAAL
jgi:hypothetical protein